MSSRICTRGRTLGAKELVTVVRSVREKPPTPIQAGSLNPRNPRKQHRRQQRSSSREREFWRANGVREAAGQSENKLYKASTRMTTAKLSHMHLYLLTRCYNLQFRRGLAGQKMKNH